MHGQTQGQIEERLSDQTKAWSNEAMSFVVCFNSRLIGSSASDAQMHLHALKTRRTSALEACSCKCLLQIRVPANTHWQFSSKCANALMCPQDKDDLGSRSMLPVTANCVTAMCWSVQPSHEGCSVSAGTQALSTFGTTNNALLPT